MKFFGKSEDGLPFHEWIKTFERYWRSQTLGLNAPDSEKLASLYEFLKEDSKRTFDFCRTTWAIENFTYDKVIDNLTALFGDKPDMSLARRELKNRFWNYQKGESLAMFYADVGVKVRKSKPYLDAGSKELFAEIKSCFVDGLERKLQEEAFRMNNLSMEELIKHLEKFRNESRLLEESLGVQKGNRNTKITDFSIEKTPNFENRNERN